MEIAFHSAIWPFIATNNAVGAPKEAGPHCYDSNVNPFLLPSLHSLSLKFEFVDFVHNSILDKLIDMLTMRDKHGHRLPVLSISEKSWGTKSHLPDEWVAKLSPLVDKLERLQNLPYE